jgi:polysaccharide biosynthesis protein PslA
MKQDTHALGALSPTLELTRRQGMPMQNRRPSAPHPQSEAYGRPPRDSNLSSKVEIIAELIKVGDLCLIYAAGFASYLFYEAANKDPLAGGLGRYAIPSLLGSFLFIATTANLGGYDPRRLRAIHSQVPRVLSAWSFAVAVLIIAAFLGKLSALYSRFWVLAWTLLVLALIVSERILLSMLLGRQSKKLFVRNVAILGTADRVNDVVARLQSCGDDGIAIRGAFDDRGSSRQGGSGERDWFGQIDDLLRLAQQVTIDQVILALPLTEGDRIKIAVDRLKRLPGEVLISVEPIGKTLPIRGLSYLGGVPMLEIVGRPIKLWAAIIKWTEDKTLALIGLLLLAPLMIIIALLIKWDSRGSVFFLQDRLGFDNKVIKVVKFRTMYADRSDQSGEWRTVRSDPRGTRVGRLLRAASLDELPQLITVLKGEMSLVGPRPHAVAMKVGERLYCDAVEEYAERHRVKPGITGWAQINGCRGEIDTLEKGRARVVYDLHYIERWSLWFDLKILLLTLPAVWSRQNAY